jgi:hypothetical protein
MAALHWERETEGPRVGMFKRFEFAREGTSVRQAGVRRLRSQSGYGSKLPTSYMVQLPGSSRWYRVYCACYSNAGTCYVCHAGKQTIVEIF